MRHISARQSSSPLHTNRRLEVTLGSLYGFRFPMYRVKVLKESRPRRDKWPTGSTELTPSDSLQPSTGGKRRSPAAALLSRNLRDATVEITSKPEDREVQYAEMRDELEGVVASPVLGTALTKSQAQGGATGAVVIGGIAAGSRIYGRADGQRSSRIGDLGGQVDHDLVGRTGLCRRNSRTAGGRAPEAALCPLPRRRGRSPGSRPGSGPRNPRRRRWWRSPPTTRTSWSAPSTSCETCPPDRLDQFDADGKVVATRDLGGRVSS